MSDEKKDKLVYRHGFVARPELKDTPKGKVLEFGLGMPHTYDDGGEVTFVNVEVWNEALQVAIGDLQRGERVAVEGYLNQREYKGKTIHTIRATRFGRVEFVKRGEARPERRVPADEDFPF